MKSLDNRYGAVNKKIGAAVLAIAVVCMTLFLLSKEEGGSALAEPAPQNLTESSREKPLSYSPVLSWSKNPEAVYYEIEFLDHRPLLLSDTQEAEDAVFRSSEVFQNHYNPPLKQFAADFLGRVPLYWRVRAMDFNGTPLTPFSELAELWTSPERPEMDAPVPVTQLGSDERGAVLLYPVYHWIPMSEADHYELQLFEGSPDNDDNRLIAVWDSVPAEVYDSFPRYSDRDFYWRVRAMNAAGTAISKWSNPKRFRTAPEDHWEIAVLGDSISHGGGHYSYGPEDLEFSWLHYLDFPAINLSESGDTIQMTLDRFDRDVLPFHPRYLLIMSGSNSLRAGEDPEVVIQNLQEIQHRCLSNGIRPVLLTLPAINPQAIQHVFQEETVEDWAQRFAAVNVYIRTQVHIDMAAAFSCPDTVLPEIYALDGLHPDVLGKRLMGGKVNAAWGKVKQDADKEMERYAAEAHQ